jgi:hypothetical protein
MTESRSRGALVSLRAWLVLPLLALLAPGAMAADYAADWGPALGSQLPLLDAQDQDGNRRNLENLSGEQGLLLFLNRSADW